MNAIVILYCEQPDMLDIQLDGLAALDPAVRDQIEIIIVDDCSEEAPAEPIVRASGLRVRLLRLDAQVPWNLGAARNTGVTAARADSVLICDLDHVLTPSGAARLAEVSVPEDVFLVPRRFTEDGEQLMWMHPHIGMMRRSVFLQLGGYDEAWWGYEGDHLFTPRRDSLLRARVDDDLTLTSYAGQGSRRWRRTGRENARMRGGDAYRDARRACARPAAICLTPWHEVTL